MTDASTQTAPKRAKPANPERVRKVADDIVTSVSLARHLCCAPSNIRRLVDAGIIERRPDNHFDQGACRARYIQHLRSEYRKSPRAVAEQDMQKHRARLYALKVQKQEGSIMPIADHHAFVEALAGLVLTKLSGWPARIAGHDLVMRRKADALIFELRTEMAKAAQEEADRIEAAA